MLLPLLISLRRPVAHELTPEDIFESSLGGVFVDDLQNQHGDDPDTIIVYRPSNPAYKQIELRTADVNGEEQRRKFAHYLWNAGILMAELLGGRPKPDSMDKRPKGESWNEEGTWKDGQWWTDVDEEKKWSVKGEKVLELGAGVGLGGITSVFAGAEQVTITDYPARPIIDTLLANVQQNLSSELRAKAAVSVYGHQWNDLDTPFASSHARRYTRILAADCLWMPYEHENLAKSMVHFLSDAPEAQVYVIAGFHTGRAKVAPFFEETVPRVGLEVEKIYEMNAAGQQRPWENERDGGKEDVGERKKWCVLARLRKVAKSAP